MARPDDITGEDLKNWSERHDAPAVLPDLVRRLILATAPVSALSIAAHGATRFAGWDGFVTATGGTSFCPDGTSVWEMTVRADLTKFSADYDKRTSDPGLVVPRATTYVAVSARPVPNKVRWVAEKRAEGVWKEVRLFDADDLAAWLSQSTGVAKWMAQHLGKPLNDIEDVEHFLATWTQRTRPALPPAVVLAGDDRQQLAETLRGWARSPNRRSPARVHGDTWEEAAVFAAAALKTDASVEGAQIVARTVVVRTIEALRWVLQTQEAQPLIAIAAFDEADTTDGRVVIPMEGMVGRARDILRLDPVPYRRIAEILIVHMPADDAMRVARESGGKVAALQRLLGYVKLPRWAESVDSVPLSAMLLVGAFEPTNQADRDVLGLLGADPREVEILCERLRLSVDAPTLKEESRNYRAKWTWRAPDDVWKYLAGQIPADLLRRYGKTVRLVLGQRDPKLDLGIEERFAAAFYGKVPPHSGVIRQGLAQSLVRLAASDPLLEVLHGPRHGSQLAARTIESLLPTGWEAWASLSNLLPLLAEAAPIAFLNQVEESLRTGDNGVARLLKEEAHIGGSPHTGLLWALETVGWDPDLMPRVADLLAKLAIADVADRPGRMANRPIRSLERLLDLVDPQTTAPMDVRIHEVRRLSTRNPDLGLQMLTSMFGGMRLLSPSRKPEFWTLSIPSEDDRQARSEGEFAKLQLAYADILLDCAGADAGRWGRLLKNRNAVRTLGTKLLDRLKLEQVQLRALDVDAKVWNAICDIRQWNFRDAPNSQDDGASDVADHERTLVGNVPEDLAAESNERIRWEQLYAALTPSDLALRHAWLFTSNVSVADRSVLETQRNAAIESLPRDSALTIIGAIVSKLVELGDVSALATTLARSSYQAELDTVLLGPAPPDILVPLTVLFVTIRTIDAGFEWAEASLRTLLTHGRTPEVDRVLLMLPSGTDTWDLLERLGEEFTHRYWKAVSYPIKLDTSPVQCERAMENLLRVGNVDAALCNAEFAKDRIGLETVARTLRTFLAADNIGASDGDTIAYRLAQLMDRLESAPDSVSYDDLLARCELLYGRLASRPARPMKRLSAAFASSPEKFVELLRDIYRRASQGMALERSGDSAEDALRAEQSYRVVAAWNGYPGEGELGDQQETLYKWSLYVLRTVTSEGRLGAVDAVGEILARHPGSPERPDEPSTTLIWPCVAARKLLESDEFPTLGSSMSLALRNSRGFTSRSLVAGGEQERVLLHKHRTSANVLRRTCPRTAAMLDNIAGSYENEGVQKDRWFCAKRAPNGKTLIPGKGVRRQSAATLSPASSE